VGTSFFRFVTIHAFDRQTDRRTDRKVLAIPCVALHAVRTVKKQLQDNLTRLQSVWHQ